MKARSRKLPDGEVLSLLVLSLALTSCAAEQDSDVYQSTIVQGIQLHYQVEGEGDPLILVHGSLADLRYWTEQMPALSRNHQVITYSRRYNYPNDNQAMPDHSATTESGDLLALMDELGLDSASVLGHSYGAYTALWFALEHPDRVDKLILAEAPILRWLPEIPGGEGIMEGFMSGVWEPLEKAYSEGGTQAGLEATSQWYFGEPLDAIEEKWRIFFTQNSREWEALTVSSDAFPYIDMQKVENLELPVLLISGARSAGNFNDLIDSQLSTLLPDARRVVIENAGHEMFLDNPHDTNQAIINFLDQR